MIFTSQNQETSKTRDEVLLTHVFARRLAQVIHTIMMFHVMDVEASKVRNYMARLASFDSWRQRN